jgi:hypothetical protein
MESSRGSLRFDEFPTNMKRRKSFEKDRAQHAYWLTKTQDRQSLVASPLSRSRLARTPPSAFPFLRITMSKSRWACGWVPHSRTFDGSKSSIKSQRQPQRSRERLGACFASVCGSRGSRLIPQDVQTTRARRSFKERVGACQGRAGAATTVFQFLLDRGREATFLPECAATLQSLTAR